MDDRQQPPDPMDELEALREQLELERGLREAADAENERLEAQIEAYAEDMGALFQEQHGRGREGLAARVADLRNQLADESAQREVASALHKRAVQRARQLSDQLVATGRDVSKAYREGSRAAASGGTPWWRRPLAMIPLATTAGLLMGAGSYAALSPPPPTPIDLFTAPIYGPPLPAELGGGVLVATGGQMIPLGASGIGTGSAADAPALAATAAAAALGQRGGDVRGTPVLFTALDATPGGTPAAPSIQAATLAAASAAAGASPIGAAAAADRVASGTPIPATTPDLAPTIVALRATGTALAAVATAGAARTPSMVAVPSPTTSIRELAQTEAKRCRFELVVPPLPVAGTYDIIFQQRNPADVVVLWSQPIGKVGLYQLPVGALVVEGSSGGAGRDVVASNQTAGSYRAQLHNLGQTATDETRVALFYDDRSTCLPQPTGSEGEALAASEEPAAPTESTPTAISPSALSPTAVAPTSAAATATPTLAAVPPTAAATGVPSTAAATAMAPAPAATATPRPASPTPQPPTPTPVRPYLDCMPYLRGPSGHLETKPTVWVDAAKTVLGTLPVRAFLRAPNGAVQSASFSATPSGESRNLALSGYGKYQFWMEAEGADLDPDCSWGFDHNIYT